mmetsp:Transcript_61291/g.181258  ORF Transcript_61291/g.181258 Transcript_61291/m.181258 type:complete len:134 (-) Transcript_61291:593-994(-)
MHYAQLGIFGTTKGYLIHGQGSINGDPRGGGGVGTLVHSSLAVIDRPYWQQQQQISKSMSSLSNATSPPSNRPADPASDTPRANYSKSKSSSLSLYRCTVLRTFELSTHVTKSSIDRVTKNAGSVTTFGPTRT